MFQTFSPTYRRSSQIVIDGLLFGMLNKTFLSTTQHILFLRHHWLLSKYAMALGTVMLRRLVVGSFVGAEDTSPLLLIPQDPTGSVAVRYRGFPIWSYILDLVCIPFPVIFDLDFGKEATPIFMVQGTIVLLIILQIFLHGLGESILNFNSNLVHREFLVADFPIRCLISIALNWKWREILC